MFPWSISVWGFWGRREMNLCYNLILVYNLYTWRGITIYSRYPNHVLLPRKSFVAVLLAVWIFLQLLDTKNQKKQKKWDSRFYNMSKLAIPCEDRIFTKTVLGLHFSAKKGKKIAIDINWSQSIVTIKHVLHSFRLHLSTRPTEPIEQNRTLFQFNRINCLFEHNKTPGFQWVRLLNQSNKTVNKSIFEDFVRVRSITITIIIIIIIIMTIIKYSPLGGSSPICYYIYNID